MGLRVRLIKEEGQLVDEVGDPKDFIGPCLPSIDDKSYCCVRFIDRYGDTYFNQLQMDTFLKEWEKIAYLIEDKEAKKVFMNVANLARQCQKSPHLYLKFEGD
jgi:hypothetical protein